MRVLVVDDEEVIRDVLGTLLTREGYEVTAAASAGEAVALFEAEPYDVVLLDLMLPDRPGPRRAAGRPPARPRCRRRHRHGVLLDRGRDRGDAAGRVPLHPQALPERGSPPDAPQGRRGAAADRGEPAAARGAVAALRPRPDRREVRRACARSSSSSASPGPSRSTILVEGESGTGKELVARAIHTHSPRSGAPFVTVNSGSMPTDLLESNLFGHVKGAFTGRDRQQEGPLRGRRRRLDLLRRDRHDLDGDAGEAPAGASRRRSSCGSARSTRRRSTRASSPRPTWT